RESIRQPLAPAVPALQVPGHGAHGMAALVPAWPRPHLEVEMAPGRIARVAHEADSLAGANAFASLGAAASPKVHVDEVVAGALAVDHHVEAGAPGLVRAVLDPATPGRDDLQAAGREHVLTLVDVARSRCAVPVAVCVPAPDRELVGVGVHGAVLTPSAPAVGPPAAAAPNAEHVGPRRSRAPPLGRARPMNGVHGPRLDVAPAPG